MVDSIPDTEIVITMTVTVIFSFNFNRLTKTP